MAWMPNTCWIFNDQTSSAKNRLTLANLIHVATLIQRMLAYTIKINTCQAFRHVCMAQLQFPYNRCGASRRPAAASAPRWRRGNWEPDSDKLGRLAACPRRSRTDAAAASSSAAHILISNSQSCSHVNASMGGRIILFFLSHRHSPVHSSQGVRTHEPKPGFKSISTYK